jgi:hypothetical protein
MAELTGKQSDWVTHLKQEAVILLESRTRIEELIAEYNNEGYSSTITDVDLEDSGFPSMTNAKMIAGVVAITSVQTALGDLSTGQAVNLLAIKGA